MTEKKLVYTILIICFMIAAPVIATKIPNFLGGVMAIFCCLYAGFCLWCLSKE